MPRRPAAPVALLTLALTGCAAVGPDYTAPDTALPAHWQSPAAASLTTAAPASDGTLARWWTALGDARLDALIERAFAASPTLAAAEARLRQSRARVGIADAGQMPNVSASGSAQRGRTGDAAPANSYRAGFDASWEADVFGGIRRGSEAARADAAATEAGLDDARVSLAAEVATNLVARRNADARLALARANLASQRDTLQLVQWRRDAGLASEVEVEQARTAVAQTEAALPTLETTRAGAAYALDVLTGSPPGTLAAELDAARALPTLPVAIAAGIPADLLRRRPDLRAAERRFAAETARVGVAQAARWPSVQLSGNLGSTALRLAALGASSTVSSALAAGVAVTLFDGGRLRQQVALQEAVRDEALANYQGAVLAALAEVENALTTLDRNDARRTALATAADAARNAATLAKQRYTAGLVDFQTVLDSERTARSADDSLASADADRLTAWIALVKALGGGWQTPASNPADRSPA